MDNFCLVPQIVYRGEMISNITMTNATCLLHQYSEPINNFSISGMFLLGCKVFSVDCLAVSGGKNENLARNGKTTESQFTSSAEQLESGKVWLLSLNINKKGRKVSPSSFDWCCCLDACRAIHRAVLNKFPPAKILDFPTATIRQTKRSFAIFFVFCGKTFPIQKHIKTSVFTGHKSLIDSCLSVPKHGWPAFHSFVRHGPTPSLREIHKST